VGYHNFELLQQLLEKREFIKSYCKVCEELLKKERQGDNYKVNYSMNAPNKQSFMVEHTIQSKGRGKKKVVQPLLQESQRISNYDLLLKLGFDRHLIAENKRLGL